MEAFGDLEKRRGSVDNPPIGREAEGLQKGKIPREELGDPAAEGGGVEMQIRTPFNRRASASSSSISSSPTRGR